MIAPQRRRGAILAIRRGSATLHNRQPSDWMQKRGWILMAAIAISFALLVLLVPHGQAGSASDFAAILPLLLVAIISPLSFLAPLANTYAGRAPESPLLVPSFQRPPPSRRS
jgi:hypothetical protein